MAPGARVQHPPSPGPVTTLRPSKYKLLVSSDGKKWRTVATVTKGTGTTDVLEFTPTQASFVRLEIDSSSTAVLPTLEELSATG
jgi:hypothetical protein